MPLCQLNPLSFNTGLGNSFPATPNGSRKIFLIQKRWQHHCEGQKKCHESGKDLFTRVPFLQRRVVEKPARRIKKMGLLP